MFSTIFSCHVLVNFKLHIKICIIVFKYMQKCCKFQCMALIKRYSVFTSIITAKEPCSCVTTEKAINTIICKHICTVEYHNFMLRL